MESTEKCEAIIQHFNGKFIKIPPGVPGAWNVCFVLEKPDIVVVGARAQCFCSPTVITEFTLVLLSQCPQSPYYVSLQTEVRRRGRTRGNTSKMEGPGLEMETR